MKKNLIHGTMALLFVLVVCISSAAVDDTVTRDLPASASAGAPITLDLTVDVETGATYYGVDEIVPSGWTVTSATDGGDYTAETGHVKWAVTAGAADKTYSYTVEVPTDASGAYTFGGIYAFEGMTVEATILGDTTVNVTDTGQPVEVAEPSHQKVNVSETVTTTAAPTAPPVATSEVTPGQVATPVEMVETPPAEVEVETPTATPKPPKTGVPGFTSVFAIAGLLAALYLVLQRRE